MIVSRTPFRVSLFGGGSDYPKWYRAHGGAVFGFAINKYCYITVRALPPFFEHKHRIVYSQVELVNTIDEVRHPSVRAVMQEMGVTQGLEIHHDGDLPARSGLGSSSSFTVGLLNALSALGGRMVSKQELAREAIRIEQDVIREHVGSQDQVWAAYGGINRITFNKDDTFSVSPVIVDGERIREFLDSTLLVFTGFSRYAPTIAKQKIANLDQRERHVHRMTAMVDEAIGIFQSPNSALKTIGEMLHESWSLKRELADQVSNPQIDEIYDGARDAGALGGKLLGAGGGGFMLFFVEPSRLPAVKKRFKDFIQVGFDIDVSGSAIVLYEPNGLANR